ncbi:MAG TPA: hypothetical protein VGD78_05340, partial [Chthoniobacterales bacterium]
VGNASARRSCDPVVTRVGSSIVMFQRIYSLATAEQFVPFTVELHSGTRYTVKTRDHVFFVRDDEGRPMEAWFEVVTGARSYFVPPESVSSVEVNSALPKTP